MKPKKSDQRASDDKALADSVDAAVKLATNALDGKNLPDDELDTLCDDVLSQEPLRDDKK